MTRDSETIFKVMVARIRYSTHNKLISLAEMDTKSNGRQIYVADLVRDAIKSYLRSREDTFNKSVLDGKEDEHKSMQYKN